MDYNEMLKLSEEELKRGHSGPEVDELQKAVEKFKQDQADKSFSQRNPHLGKMHNCKVCGHRHRTATICIPRYNDINQLRAKRKIKKAKQKK